MQFLATVIHGGHCLVCNNGEHCAEAMLTVGSERLHVTHCQPLLPLTIYEIHENCFKECHIFHAHA